MAIRVMLAIVMACAVACGDSASSGDELDCEGEARLLNYRACVGDDQYFEEWAAMEDEGRALDRAATEAEPADTYECESGAVAHMCHYDETIHDSECRWAPAPYAGEHGAKPEMKCRCWDPSFYEDWDPPEDDFFIDDGDRSRCPDD